jgi:hypothetical protein
MPWWRYPAWVENIGKTMVVAGLCLAGLGLLVWLLGPRMSGQGGLLPGDIHIHKGQTSFYFPIVTCLVVSVVLSLLMRLFNR